jgi:hypothetical protein
MNEKICPGLDICQHYNGIHAKPHKDLINSRGSSLCGRISCNRPAGLDSIVFVPKTKPRCVSYAAVLEQKRKSLPKRRLRPCKEWED